MPQQSLVVEPVPALKDNYIWMFATGAGHWAVVDPGEVKPVQQFLQVQEGRLSHILLTHHHHDHIGGVAELRKAYGVPVIGSEKDHARLPPLDMAVGDGQQLVLGATTVSVMEMPGHTSGHVVYRVDNHLFAGDTLFRFGCGRIFEGTPERMWESLQRLRQLPDETLLCAAHEYTLVNLQFACSLEPNNQTLQNLLKDIFQQTDMELPTMPSVLGDEKRYNPFFRADDAAFARDIGLSGYSAEQVFTSIRKKRNSF
ncbi:MAG: hydroxyacylglutathione hydrolase [Magnetococcales bacterium]|nr:hydroxyacylglutathione hydrolase [Magnetococcales bacterium]